MWDSSGTHRSLYHLFVGFRSAYALDLNSFVVFDFFQKKYFYKKQEELFVSLL